MMEILDTLLNISAFGFIALLIWIYLKPGNGAGD